MGSQTRTRDEGGLFDAVNDVPHVSMVFVMINSEDDPMALDATAQARRSEIEQLRVRNGVTATVTASADFNDILHRRLFEASARKEFTDSTLERFATAMGGVWEAHVFGKLPRMTHLEFANDVERCYPFHPSLIALAEREWAQVAGFQKVR